jgi:hypothetical protein
LYLLLPPPPHVGEGAIDLHVTPGVAPRAVNLEFGF